MAKTIAQRRQTREERDAKREAERRAERIAEFQQHIARERAKTIYSQTAAWKAGLSVDGRCTVVDERAHNSGMALYQLVHEYDSARRQITDLVERLQRRCAEMTQRLSEGRLGSGYSTVLGDVPADLEQANAKAEALKSSIAQMAWATGWYVAEISDERARNTRRLLVSLDVIEAADAPGTFIVRSTQDSGTFFLAVSDDANKPLYALVVTSNDAQRYDSADAAWLAAMALVGEHRW